MQVAILIIDRLDEETFAGVTWDDGGCGLAATEEACAGIEAETSLDLFTFLAVTFVTVFDEDWADLFFEESELRRVIGGEDRGGSEKEKAASGEDRELDRPRNHRGTDFLVGRIWKK